MVVGFVGMVVGDRGDVGMVGCVVGRGRWVAGWWTVLGIGPGVVEAGWRMAIAGTGRYLAIAGI
jgi:hypothetical protein